MDIIEQLFFEYIIIKYSAEKFMGVYANEYRNYFASKVDEGFHNICIDITDVRLIDSAGIGSLVDCVKYLIYKSGITGCISNLSICVSTDNLMFLLKLNKIHDVIKIYKSVDEFKKDNSD